jgi:hypothetical protein
MFILNKFKEKNFMLALKNLLLFLTKDMTLVTLRQVKAEVVSLPNVLKWIPPVK